MIDRESVYERLDLFVENLKNDIQGYRTRVNGASKYLDISMEFARNVTETNLGVYDVRNPTMSKQKMYFDNLNGKLAEFVVSDLLGSACENPDLKIYGREKKSFSRDLTYRGTNLHVKSCRYGTPYPPSWLFEKYDPLIENPKDYDFLACCIIDGREYPMPVTVQFYWMPGVVNKVREPVEDRLKSDKWALYKFDLTDDLLLSIRA